MGEQFYVYIMTNKYNGTLYTGVTSNLLKRVYEHKNGLIDGFTKKYNLKLLVHFEIANNPITAIAREKNIKTWKREWKINLIESDNPDWKDLSKEFE